jgi:hypothetical protein
MFVIARMTRTLFVSRYSRLPKTISAFFKLNSKDRSTVRRDSCNSFYGFQSQSGQTKGYKIDICCFSTKQVSIRSKNKDCLTRNHDNVSVWCDVSNRGLSYLSFALFPCSRIKVWSLKDRDYIMH